MRWTTLCRRNCPTSSVTASPCHLPLIGEGLRRPASDIEYPDHDDADDDQGDHGVVLPGELFLQEDPAPEDGCHAVGRDDRCRERDVRLVGQRVDVGELARRLFAFIVFNRGSGAYLS